MGTLPIAFFTYFFQLDYSQRVVLGTRDILKGLNFHFGIDFKHDKGKKIIIENFYFLIFLKNGI